MMRGAVSVLLLAVLGCRPGASTPASQPPVVAAEDAPGSDESAAVEDAPQASPVPDSPPTPESPPPPAPAELLAQVHHTGVEILRSLELSDGVVVAYRVHLWAEWKADESDERHETIAKIEAYRRECEQERSTYDPEQLEMVAQEGTSCLNDAVFQITRDELLWPDCQVLGLAYFDGEGALRDHVAPKQYCVIGVDLFELRELPGHPQPELFVRSEHEVFGYSQAMWERIHAARILQIVRLHHDEHRIEPLLQIRLEHDAETGVTSPGTRARFRITSKGHVEVYARSWDSVDEPACGVVLDPGVDPQKACPFSRLWAERYRWNPESLTWGRRRRMKFPPDGPPSGLGDGG